MFFLVKSQEFGVNPDNHHPFIVRLKGQNGVGCSRYKSSQIIICPENFEMYDAKLKIQGYPSKILAKDVSSKLPTRPNTPTPVETINCTGNLIKSGKIKHRCATESGSSGGPIFTSLFLKDGEKIDVIAGVTSGWSMIDEPSSDGAGWNYGSTPVMTQSQLDSLANQIFKCEEKKWHTTYNSKSCNIIDFDETTQCVFSERDRKEISKTEKSEILFCKGGIFTVRKSTLTTNGCPQYETLQLENTNSLRETNSRSFEGVK